MNEDAQQQRERKRSGWRIALIVVILLLLYVLSPPFVVEMVGVETYVNHVAWFYWPLKQFSHSSELVRNRYGQYFDLVCSSEQWYALFLSPEMSEQGGYGRVEQIEPLF